MENYSDIIFKKLGNLKRGEKKVSLEKLVELYKHFKNKRDLFWKEYQIFYDKEIKPVLNSGILEIPYESCENGDIRVFKFSSHTYLGKKYWGHSTDTLRPTDRESKLDWLLVERDFTLGKKLQSYQKVSHRSYYFVLHALTNALSHYCRKEVMTSDLVINITVGSDTLTLVKKDPHSEWSTYTLATTSNIKLDSFEIEHNLVRH